MNKLVQFVTGAPEPDEMFVREVADYMGTARLMRQQMERLAALPYKPGEPAWALTNTTDATARFATAMARMLGAQAAGARSLALLRSNGTKHVVIEHRLTGAGAIPGPSER